MKHQQTFKGTVVEVLNNSYINIENQDKEIIPCYIVKSVAAKGWTPNVGTPAEFKGGFKVFANGTNYFVIHKIENFLLGSYKTQTYFDKNENLPYLDRVVKAIKSAPCRKYYSDSVKAELIDAETGEKIEVNLPASYDFDLKFWGSNGCTPHMDVFYSPGIFREFNNANLANKKWGSKVEAKLKVEIIEIRRKIGSSEPWQYVNIEDTGKINCPLFPRDFYKEIKKTLHSRKDWSNSKHGWNLIGGGYVRFEVSKVRITVQK